MRRDPVRLGTEEFELVVVGGGIYGACAARDAAMRGWKVALIEAGDFGGGTSSNSLRILHGGLRHLQRLDVVRMRESIRARSAWLRLAPHLARPLRFSLSTSGHGLAGPEALSVALTINDIVSLDRNRGLAAGRRLGRGYVLGGGPARALFAGARVEGVNGAALWYDGVCLNSERLLLWVVAAAARAGACVSNYVQATGLRLEGGAVGAVLAHDVLSGQALQVRTRAVIDATGCAVGSWMGLAGNAPPLFKASRAFNLLTRALPFKDGMGFKVRCAHGGTNTYFVVPWNGRSLIGTRHLHGGPEAGAALITRQEVLEFISDLNGVLGRWRLAESDVLGVFSGVLPERGLGAVADLPPRAAAGRGPGPASVPEVELQRSPRIVDHATAGVKGAFSVIGVKWTTSAVVAERVVAVAGKYLRSHCNGPSQVRRDRQSHRQQASAALASRPHREETYGPAGPAVTELEAREPALATPLVTDLPVTRAQIIQCVRDEMAMQLVDIVMRRTPLYLSEHLNAAVLRECATLMAGELNWSTAQVAEQLRDAAHTLSRFRGWGDPIEGRRHEDTPTAAQAAAASPAASDADAAGHAYPLQTSSSQA